MTAKSIARLTKKQVERFWQKVAITADIERCWEWLGSRQIPTGHGRVNLNGSVRLAHRVSYALVNGEIEIGMVVRHKCHLGQCVNPHHLVLGTQAENVKDMWLNKNPIQRHPHPLPRKSPMGKISW